jgi:hypothetical protein
VFSCGGGPRCDVGGLGVLHFTAAGDRTFFLQDPNVVMVSGLVIDLAAESDV